MELLEAARESLFFPSCGPQADSSKPSNPSWSLPKASRDAVKRVYISNKHKQDLLGKDSPGFAYTPQRLKNLPKWGFGTAEARPALRNVQYPESSNDLLGNIPDSQPFKYPEKVAKIGTCSRDGSYNAPDLEGFPAGAISPGPQRYNISGAPPAVRLAHAPKVDQVPPKFTMRPKTKILEADSQTPARVGPGLYPLPDACGTQPRSERKSLPQWSLHKTDRFPEKVEYKDSGRLWDGLGDKKAKFSRVCSVPPSFSFGTSTRFNAQKVAPVYTELDKGPKANIGNMARH